MTSSRGPAPIYNRPRRTVKRWNLRQRPGNNPFNEQVWIAQLSCGHEDWWRDGLGPSSLNDKPPKTLGCRTCATQKTFAKNRGLT